MKSSLGRKLSSLAAIATLATAGGVAWSVQARMAEHLAGELRHETQTTANLLAARMQDEIRHLAEQAEWRIQSPGAALDPQGSLIAVTVLEERAGQWVPVLQLRHTPPRENSADLDRRFPLAPTRFDQTQIVVARLSDGTPLLRIAVPRISPPRTPSRTGASQAVVLEVPQAALTRVFSEAATHTNFLLDTDGRLLAQTPPDRFTLGEDLSHLPIWSAARARDHGQLDYRDVSRDVRQFASFRKLGVGGFVLVSQASERELLDSLAQVNFRIGLIAAAGAALAWALMVFGVSRLLGARLRRLAKTLRRLETQRTHVRMPDRKSRDEIGVFAAALQRFCNRLVLPVDGADPLAVQPSPAATKSEKSAPTGLHAGETLPAWIVVGKLQGLDLASDHGKAPDLFRGLNAFLGAAAQLIRKHHGVLERTQGGTLVACWGIPKAQGSDADHALTCALELRACAQKLITLLTHLGFPEVRFSVGVHRGPIAAGRLGTDDQASLLVLGESTLLAQRLADFTAQFGTDILVTQPAVEAAPIWFKTEKLASADGPLPEIYELTGKSSQAGAAA